MHGTTLHRSIFIEFIHLSDSKLAMATSSRHPEGKKNALRLAPTYAPNEADLKVASLKTLLASLKTRNDEVAKVNTLQNARVNREKIFF